MRPAQPLQTTALPWAMRPKAAAQFSLPRSVDRGHRTAFVKVTAKKMAAWERKQLREKPKAFRGKK